MKSYGTSSSKKNQGGKQCQREEKMPKILLSSGRWGMVERKEYLWRVRKTYLFINLVLKIEFMWLVTRNGASLINVQIKMGRVTILICSLWGIQLLRQVSVSWHSKLKLSFLWFHAFQPIPILWQEWVLVCVCIMECLDIWYKMRKFLKQVSRKIIGHKIGVGWWNYLSNDKNWHHILQNVFRCSWIAWCSFCSQCNEESLVCLSYYRS